MKKRYSLPEVSLVRMHHKESILQGSITIDVGGGNVDDSDKTRAQITDSSWEPDSPWS